MSRIKFPAPICKIVGGKSKVFKSLLPLLPETVLKKEMSYYAEPFFGAGGFFFALHKFLGNWKISGAINDFNPDTFNVYNILVNNSQALGDIMLELKEDLTRERYYQIRSGFTEQFDLDNPGVCLHRAALFIYLNKVGFNGLIRYNKSGKFNVPYGVLNAKEIFYQENFEACKTALSAVDLHNLDFSEFISKVIPKLDEKSFVYLDPPYLPISDTAKFVEYSKEGFSEMDHIRLRHCLNAIDRIGAKFMLSNSYCPLVETIFEGFNFHTITASRTVGVKKGSRGACKEYVITNY